MSMNGCGERSYIPKCKLCPENFKSRLKSNIESNRKIQCDCFWEGCEGGLTTNKYIEKSREFEMGVYKLVNPQNSS